jgi:hypothetical protein
LCDHPQTPLQPLFPGIFLLDLTLPRQPGRGREREREIRVPRPPISSQSGLFGEVSRQVRGPAREDPGRADLAICKSHVELQFRAQGHVPLQHVAQSQLHARRGTACGREGAGRGHAGGGSRELRLLSPSCRTLLSPPEDAQSPSSYRSSVALPSVATHSTCATAGDAQPVGPGSFSGPTSGVPCHVSSAHR